MPQSATIKSLPRAFRMMKAMQGDGVEWGEDYRHAAADALKTILHGRMETSIDRHLATMAAHQEADRRNGCYRRHLLTELGDIELEVPRTRRYSALEVVRAYARRVVHVDRMILACFVLGSRRARWRARCCPFAASGQRRHRERGRQVASMRRWPPSTSAAGRHLQGADARWRGAVAQDGAAR